MDQPHSIHSLTDMILNNKTLNLFFFGRMIIKLKDLENDLILILYFEFFAHLYLEAFEVQHTQVSLSHMTT